ncbi:EamA family transporter [Geothrix sp. PMB-07]|uniref:EamA family transporter n=1 Tax=Geothrix sp. PMB-07 TaxID=3068640 RepID=UPI002740FC17|nr:EamA family transporter [Geothrix sp. PMB-07]WLT31730.1 EamA family transporter [Geothrix sp. PMB-07]
MAWFGWALAALGFMGLANLGMKAASMRGLGSASVLFWVVLGELPLALLYWGWRGRPSGPPAGVAWGFGAGLCTAVALILLNESFSRGAKAAVAVGIMNANFALVALLAFLLFREQLQPSKLVGLAATLSGLWLMAR